MPRPGLSVCLKKQNKQKSRANKNNPHITNLRNKKQENTNALSKFERVGFNLLGYAQGNTFAL